MAFKSGFLTRMRARWASSTSIADHFRNRIPSASSSAVALQGSVIGISFRRARRALMMRIFSASLELLSV